ETGIAWASCTTETLSRRPMRARYFRNRFALRVLILPAAIRARPPANSPITGDIAARDMGKPQMLLTTGRPDTVAIPKRTAMMAPIMVMALPLPRLGRFPAALGGGVRTPWVPGLGPR